MALLAIFPLLIFVIWLLIDHKASILKIALIVLGIVISEALFIWKMSFLALGGQFWKGILIAFDIFMIVFGAILFWELLKKYQVTQSLAIYLNNISGDIRVQVILLGWFLEAFLEGVAGFGTPAIVVGPMLLALGLSPLQSMTIALLGNGVPVIFGAAGTPVRVLSGTGVDILLLGQRAALYNLAGIIVPMMIVWVALAGDKNRKQEFFDFLPMSIMAGILFWGASLLVSFLGIEFPSILGSIISLVLFLGIFSIWDKGEKVNKNKADLPLFRVIFPYVTLVSILILFKILGKNVNPGVAFLITAVIISICYKGKIREWKNFIKSAFKSALSPFLLVAIMSFLVQVMNGSGMIVSLIGLFKNRWLPVMSMWIGTLGSFVTGSATVSNLMFGNLIKMVAESMGMEVIGAMAWLLVGGGVGNMIAIADTVATKAVIGGKETLTEVLMKVLPYCMIYLCVASLLAMVLR